MTLDNPAETDKKVAEFISIVDDMIFAFVTGDKKGEGFIDMFPQTGRIVDMFPYTAKKRKNG